MQTEDDKLKRAIARARTTGQYKLSYCELETVPPLLYSFAPIEGIAFYEEVAPTSIDLAGNALTSIPEELCGLAELASLILRHNRLASLPAAFARLRSLQQLDVSSNQLTELKFAGLLALRRLDCSRNGLASLDVSGCARLAELDASGCGLQSLPLVGCTGLVRLNLRGNRLTELPLLEDLQALQELDVSENAVPGALPPSIGALRWLRILDLARNGLEALAPELGACTALVELRLGCNRLTELPGELGMLSALQVLDVQGNRLREVNEGICRLSLTLLDVSSNDIATLTPLLGTMTTLRALPLAGNPIRGMRPTLLSGPVSSLLASLRNRLPDPEQEIPADARVTVSAAASRNGKLGGGGSKIDLSGSGLSELPPEVVNNAPNIEHLDLSHNRFSAWPLPPEPGRLPRLHTLNLTQNAGLEVPQTALASCRSSLTALDLTGVRSVGPAGTAFLVELPALCRLDLARCGLAEIPAEILGLHGLQVLGLSGNAIAQIPEAVSRLGRLTELDLSNNNITSLPPALGLLDGSLRVLRLEGNPLRSIRRPVLERGTAAVLAYLKDRIPQQ